MIVRRSNFESVLNQLRGCRKLAADTETTGLRPFHGDRLFSIIIAANPLGSVAGYYFNFQAYPGLESEFVLGPSHMTALKELFALPGKLWFAHNAKFDMAMLRKEGVMFGSDWHCTLNIARVEYNDHMTYSLAACLERIGLAKDDAVEKYIIDNNLWDWVSIPGKKARKKNLHYDKVPFDIIVPYGISDAIGCFKLGESQEVSIAAQSAEAPESVPPLSRVMLNERRFTRTVSSMEQRGIKIDRAYCMRAASYETGRGESAIREFRKETGRDFLASTKLFQDVFRSESDAWEFTDKGNPSFESDILKKFKNPAAQIILEYRDSKSKADFYNGFLYHADANDILHPNIYSGGTIHGRSSSSDPNLQNLTAEDDETEQEFVVRRAFIPRDGFVFIMPDWSGFEYLVALDYACNMLGRLSPLGIKVNAGLDFHAATIQVVKELAGIDLPRKTAKIANFLTLYGGGDKALAAALKCSLAQAREIRRVIKEAAPEIDDMIQAVTHIGETRGFIFNWMGRKCNFPNSRYAYKGTNYLVSGGCADAMKLASNQIDETLLGYKSKMLLNIHDELPTEVHESEITGVPKIVTDIMLNAYPHKMVPMKVDMEFSYKSLADKQKGWPA